MLNSLQPMPYVLLSVLPLHLTQSRSQVLSKFTFISIPVLPFIDSITAYLVILELTLVILSINTFPNPITLPFTTRKIAYILISILPYILPKTFTLIFFIISLIKISITKILKPLPIFNIRPSIFHLLLPHLNKIATINWSSLYHQISL